MKILSAILFSILAMQGPLSVRIVKSEMTNAPQATYLDGMEGKMKWNYTTGLELKAMLDVYCQYFDNSFTTAGSEILDYVDAWYDEVIADDGTIGANYKLSNYSTDHICPGNTLFTLYDLTRKSKYLKAMDKLAEQLESQPRTAEGGFWHKKIYKDQMWLDGLYMAEPFYAHYTALYGKDKKKAFKDIVDQFLIVAEHTYDPATGLYRHAWDSSHEMFWCDKETGQSDHAWGRALGWYCMAIVDALPYIPEGTPGRDKLIEIFNGICKQLPKYADKKSGMWYQVLDQPGREGNYVEASCSAMFTYAMLKGVRMGYLPRSMKKYAKKCYEQLLAEFVKDDGSSIELQRCCEVAGLGGKDNRRGDYNYYIGERVRSNDPKGIGPLIWAALEMERKK